MTELPPQINEIDPATGGYGPALTLLGQLVGFTGVPGSSAGIYINLTISEINPPIAAKIPPAPALSGAVISRTQQDLSWVAGVAGVDTPPVTQWAIESRSSTNGGTTFSDWLPVSGSPFGSAVLTSSRTSLAVGTPEIIYQWRVRGINLVGPGDWSNIVALQFGGNPVTQPTAPTGLAFSNLTQTSVRLAWAATADASVTKHGIFIGSATTPVVDNIGPSERAYDWTGLNSGAAFNNVSVKRWNGQWSPASNTVSFQTLTGTPVTFDMLVGVSVANASPGGFANWDLYRCYNQSKLLEKSNKAGTARPKMIFYSKDGPNLGGSNPDYTTVYNEVRADLDMFYYDSTPSTQSARWNVKLCWLNGNENSDKGALSPAPANFAGHTAAQVEKYLISQKALYDAVHYAPGGVRRYPNAYASSNPTQEQERKGWVQNWLHASARYHDLVVWSMYPPGRGVNEPAWAVNPRWDWPTFNDSEYAHTQKGYLVRCYRRTKAAQAQARIDTGNAAFKLGIGCGEVGIPSNPDDRACRPYYAVHALFGAMWQLAVQYNLEMFGACWWDERVSATKPHNELDDEPPLADHLSGGTGATGGNNATATNPSTAAAIRNWKLYDKRQPGSSQPAQWAGFPRPTVTSQALANGTRWWVEYGTPI